MSFQETELLKLSERVAALETKIAPEYLWPSQALWDNADKDVVKSIDAGRPVKAGQIPAHPSIPGPQIPQVNPNDPIHAVPSPVTGPAPLQTPLPHPVPPTAPAPNPPIKPVEVL